MNINEALTVREGDYVIHKMRGFPKPGGGVEFNKLRVTKVWQNEKRTIVMFRVHALSGQGWIHAEAFEKWVAPSREPAHA